MSATEKNLLKKKSVTGTEKNLFMMRNQPSSNIIVIVAAFCLFD